MSIIITSETSTPAADGQPHSRRTIGLGEVVGFTANHPVRWTVFGNTSPRPVTTIRAQFTTAGVHTISAEAGGERASLQLSVVTPSIAVNKKNELAVPGALAAAYSGVPPAEAAERGLLRGVPPDNAVGAAMVLEFFLTPLGVSFANLQFRERICQADQIWGYWATHRSDPAVQALLRHRTREIWLPVNVKNRAQVDLASFWLNPSNMFWPFAAGGFQLPIPDEYRIAPPISPRIDASEIWAPIGPQVGSESQVFRFDARMPQTVRIDPAPGCTTPPFRGTFTIWKGGQQVVGRYP